MPSTNAAALASAPASKIGPFAHGGQVRIISESFTYNTDVAGSYVVGGGKLPVGARVLYSFFNTSVTTGSATIALGIAGSTNKYITALAVTTPNANSSLNLNSGLLTATTTEEELLLTVAAASLPASGTLRIVVLYVVD